MRRRHTMAIVMALVLAAGLGVWLAVLTGDEQPNRTEIARSDTGLDLAQDEAPAAEVPPDAGGSQDPAPGPYPHDGPDDLAPVPTPKPGPQDGPKDLAPEPTPKPGPQDGPKGLGI